MGSDRFEHELYLTPLTPDPASSHRPTPIPVGVGLGGPAWSADGRRLAAVAASGARDDDRIVLLSCDGDILRSFKLSFQGIADLTWSPDGRYVAFLAPTPSGNDRRGDGDGFELGRTMRDLEGRTDGLRAGDDWQLHLYLLDIATGDTAVISQECIYVNGYAFAPEAPNLAYCGRVSQHDQPSQPGTIQPSALWIMDWNRPDSPRRIVATDRGARAPAFTLGARGLCLWGSQAYVSSHCSSTTSLSMVDSRSGSPKASIAPAALRTSNFQGGSAAQYGRLCRRLLRSRWRGGATGPASARDPGQLRLIAGSADESISSVSTDRTGERLAFVTTELDLEADEHPNT